MNREIKFRGQRIDPENSPGKWEYGSLISVAPPDDIPYFSKLTYPIIWNENGVYSVNPKTVGEYTGLKDKNGTEIYEGDILIIADAHFDGYADEGDIFSEEIKSDITSEVVFTEGCFQIYYEEGAPVPLFGYTSDSEIIGNIHQNPELLDPELLTPKQ